MSKKNKTEKGMIDRTLERIAVQKQAPTSFYFTLLLLYIAANIAVSSMAGSNSEIRIGGQDLPVHTIVGVFSSLANICVIFMTVYCGKKGYFTAILLLTLQLPIIFMGVLVKHNITSLPGIFGNILAIIAVTIIYSNSKRVNEYQERLREQAVTDRLTGLPNRFACSELIDALIRKNERFAAVSIDINAFKSINDTMGFDTGNKVLVEIASRWEAIADNNISGTLDFITRISGDEFVLIIRNYSSDEDIRRSVSHYESVLGNRMLVEGCDFYITASFGYAEYPSDAKTKDSVLSYADTAMHEVKRLNSSNHVLRFSPEMLRAEHTLEIESRIREALEHDTIYFNLQPQFGMNHKLRGFEVLARMKDKDGKVISPGEFIPVAEKVGLVDKVDSAVFRKAAGFFGELLRTSGADLTLSINVSVRHLMKSDFLDEIRELLRVSGVPANNLEIEITESIMIDSVDKALRCIEEIRTMGVKLAIDDFGTGYSSLSYLNSFPANLLKIDKSFIDKMNTSDSSKQYVAAIISIGHIMGFDVISEGVEEPEQLETLREIGCDYIQGFIWGRPLPQEEVPEVIRKYAEIKR